MTVGKYARTTHSERIEGLRYLRTGYGTVQAAVGFWRSLRGEDLIEVFAETVAELERVERERDGCCSPDASDDFCLHCPNGGL